MQKGGWDDHNEPAVIASKPNAQIKCDRACTTYVLLATPYLLKGCHIHWGWLCVHSLDEASISEVCLGIELLRLCQQLLQVCTLGLAHRQAVLCL
jgi:hypothetical protein